jgi:hypothetical protein
VPCVERAGGFGRPDCNSQSAIFMAKNLAYHFKTKQHIDVQYHVVRDMVEDKKVDTLKNIADSFIDKVCKQ